MQTTRIILTIRKKHHFHQQLCDDLSKLFRKAGDYGEFRKEETADPDTILSRLDDIIKKWDAMEQQDPEQCLISKETRDAITNLKKAHLRRMLFRNTSQIYTGIVQELLDKE